MLDSFSKLWVHLDYIQKSYKLVCSLEWRDNNSTSPHPSLPTLYTPRPPPSGCARFPELLTFLIWTLKKWEFRRHRKWSLNRQFQCESTKNYRAQTPQYLTLTKILQKFRKTSTSQGHVSRDKAMHGIGLHVGIYSKTIQMAHTRRLVVTS